MSTVNRMQRNITTKSAKIAQKSLIRNILKRKFFVILDIIEFPCKAEGSKHFVWSVNVITFHKIFFQEGSARNIVTFGYSAYFADYEWYAENEKQNSQEISYFYDEKWGGKQTVGTFSTYIHGKVGMHIYLIALVVTHYFFVSCNVSVLQILKNHLQGVIWYNQEAIKWYFLYFEKIKMVCQMKMQCISNIRTNAWLVRRKDADESIIACSKHFTMNLFRR